MNAIQATLTAIMVGALAPLAAHGAPADSVKGPGAANHKGHYGALERLPDWGGVWTLELGGPRAAPPQPKGAYLARYQALAAQAAANNGEFPRQGSYCAPPGMPYQMGVPQYPIEFVFSPGRITILFEAWMQVRRVFTDGRDHPQDAEATFYGHSTGTWSGETLTVDTTGTKPAALLAAGIGHSDKEHIVEHIHLAPGDPDLLMDEMTVTDPEALQQPWSVTYRFRRHRDWDLLEFVCAENDRNPLDSKGVAVIVP